MSSYGMIVRNGNNQAIIDSAYKNLEVIASGRVTSLGEAVNKRWFKIEDSGMAGALLFVRASDPAARICPMKRQSTRQYFLCDAIDHLDYLIVKPNRQTAANHQSGYGLAVFDAAGYEVYSSQKRYGNLTNSSKVVDSSGNSINPQSIRSRTNPFYGHVIAADEYLHASFSGFFMVEIGQTHCTMGATFFRRDAASGRVAVLNEVFYRNDISPSVPFPAVIFEGMTNSGSYYNGVVSECVLTSIKES